MMKPAPGPDIPSSRVISVHLPDVGEGLAEAEIIEWHVSVGDSVAVNQTIVDIETAKARVELPCPYEGSVVRILVPSGVTVPVGTSIIEIATDEVAPDQFPESQEGATATIDHEPRLLVGYGPTNDLGAPLHRELTQPLKSKDAEPTDSELENTGRASVRSSRTKPPLRKLAKSLGVDIRSVQGTGDKGLITRSDIESMAEALQLQQRGTGDPTLRIPITGVRKYTAAALVASAFTAPHVTIFKTVDITATLSLRETLNRRKDLRDLRFTPLVFVARAFLAALRGCPAGNSSWNENAHEILQFRHVNLGIAAATPRGLVVPNIKNAHQMGLVELAQAIDVLTTRARSGETQHEEMAGGTVTITNIGVFGIDTGTPILNPGEATILAVGAIQRRPWIVEDEQGERVVPRSVMELGMSFDHRVMDGMNGAKLLMDTADYLADPALFAL
jgi:pyruvate dehydrogenase E2 component (dihydrolipoamide acetyltransferase)